MKFSTGEVSLTSYDNTNRDAIGTSNFQIDPQSFYVIISPNMGVSYQYQGIATVQNPSSSDSWKKFTIGNYIREYPKNGTILFERA